MVLTIIGGLFACAGLLTGVMEPVLIGIGLIGTGLLLDLS